MGAEGSRHSLPHHTDQITRALCCRMTSSRDGRTWTPSVVQCQSSLVQCVCHHVRVAAVSVRRRRAPAVSHRPCGGRPPAAHMSQVSPTSTLHVNAEGSPSAPCYDIALQLVALSRAFHTTMHRTVDLRLTVEMSRREEVWDFPSLLNILEMTFPYDRPCN